MDHNHTNCCCDNHDKNQTVIGRKRLFSLGFIIALTLIIKPFMADQLIKRADAYYSFGFYDDAIRQYKKAILFSKADSDVWISLGNSFKAKEEINKAKAAFQEAVKIAPGDRAANFNMGMALAMNKDYKSAIVYFEKVRCLGVEPKEQPILGSLSHYRMSLKMLAICLEKIQEFEKAAIIREELRTGKSL